MEEIILSKQSSENEIKAYFEYVVSVIDSKRDEFPINLDSVWALVYADKGKAVRVLTDNFIEEVDYKVFTQIGEKPLGDCPTNEYYISVSCLEFFIARKVCAVFEVYRQVFHAEWKGQRHPMPMTHIQMLAAQAQAMAELEQRQLVTENKAEQIENRIHDNGFMSVMGFANIHHLNIGKKAAQTIGRLASKWCKRNGFLPEKTKHERWGSVNTYPTAALKFCFAEFYSDKRDKFSSPTLFVER